MRTFGVEEELLIVDPESGEPLALADALLSGRRMAADDSPDAPRLLETEDKTVYDDEMGLSAELKLEQIETQTRPCLEYRELLEQIRAGRALADKAAKKNHARVAALATSPLGLASHTTPDPRYARMLERFGLTAQEQLTCGFHVHTYIESHDEGVAVLDRIRDKLAVLTALSANSPFWNGIQTGFESYRTQAWNRWPTAGPTGIYGTYSAYRRVVTRLLDSGVMLDEGMLYFDARLSRNHPTVEVRVADVCLRAEDAALIAVLVRALVETASREWQDGVDPAPVPTVLLRMASWQASSAGLSGELLDFGTFRPARAADVVRSLVDYLAPVLQEQGELALARQGVEDIIARGTGAAEQRRVRDKVLSSSQGGDLGFDAVVKHAVDVTMRGGLDLSKVDEAPELLRVRQS
ncbi:MULTISPECIES: glutamate--cysteine ligase 2 [Micrococcaceae]|uniref:glutamate--cysteine ligase 2 n=1 Tax=Micrococcaceae TaxID=1268 RepID=UPI0012F832D0|nr:MULTISPECIES: glutamate--cysteine ligase [Pseudarthrobacter]MUU71811.1 YbdK family carboxylate-amine ligase [Pseudarthrobacter sp. GA104]WPU09175.1 glutamate--cysteine ligase [Pseudarthrobacter oxydans]HET7781404.1 glutamate--cysteine ligase [Arthrobacter sp.]